MSGSTEFFAPLIVTSPWSGVPPLIIKLSIWLQENRIAKIVNEEVEPASALLRDEQAATGNRDMFSIHEAAAISTRIAAHANRRASPRREVNRVSDAK